MNSSDFRLAVAHMAGDLEVQESIEEACKYIDEANKRIYGNI